MGTLSLAQGAFLKNLSSSARNTLCEAITFRPAARQDVLFSQHDVADGVYFIQSGKVKLTRTMVASEGSEPRESLLWLLGAGSMFGEMSCLDGLRRSSSATVVSPGIVGVLPADDLWTLVNSTEEIARELLRHLAARLRWTDLVVAGLSLHDVPGRVARTLLYLADVHGVIRHGELTVHHDLTQAELAMMVGATRETVNRVLVDFAGRGVIRNSTRKITILDEAALHELAR